MVMREYDPLNRTAMRTPYHSTHVKHKHIPLRLILHSGGNSLPASSYNCRLNDSNPVTNTTLTASSLSLSGEDELSPSSSALLMAVTSTSLDIVDDCRMNGVLLLLLIPSGVAVILAGGADGEKAPTNDVGSDGRRWGSRQTNLMMSAIVMLFLWNGRAAISNLMVDR